MKTRPVDLEKLARRKRSHSIFSPSSAAMWMHCAGSLVPNAMAPESSSYVAAEGTVAHMLAEDWLATGVRPLDRIGDTVSAGEGDDRFDIEITREMIDHIESYVNYCNELPGDHFVEQRVDISRLTPIPDQAGTSDHAAAWWTEDGGVLVITDLKFGMEMIRARRNFQLLLYALGRFFELDWMYGFRHIVIRVAQPRLDHFDKWELTRDELLMFAGQVQVRAELAWRVDAPRSPSAKACQYCSEKERCPARVVWLQRLTSGQLATLAQDVTSVEMIDAMEELHDPLGSNFFDVPDVPTLSLEDMGFILPHRKMIESWFKAMGELAEKYALEDRRPIPNMKLVRGRGSREYTIEDARVMAQWYDFTDGKGGDVFEHKLKSPNKIDTLMTKLGIKPADRKKFLEPITRSVPGAPTLVPLSDKRPVYNDGLNRFNDLVDEEDDPAADL